MKDKKQILILGGGFAGLRLARNLRKNKSVKVTLITDATTFRYCPALYRSATGFAMRESVIPIRQITNSYQNLHVIHQKVVSIDRANRSVKTDDGKVHKYDKVVICLGVVTSYFGISGLEEFSFNIKSPEGLHRLKTHLHKTLSDTGKPDANYVVVGGGPTGVELSAALASYLKKITKKHKVSDHSIKLELVEAAPRLLPILTEKASDLVTGHLQKLGVMIWTNEAVKAETIEEIKLASSTIATHTVIWTAGVTNNPFFKSNPDQFQLNERGKVLVNEYMQIDEDSYVIGDNAATTYGGLALTAIRDANYVSAHIAKSIKGGESKPYIQKKPISVIPAGENWSVLQYNNFVLSGIFPAILRSIADLIGYTDVMGPKMAYSIWSKRTKSEETCRVCKSHLQD